MVLCTGNQQFLAHFCLCESFLIPLCIVALGGEALSAGIDAVMSAMSAETRFTNENEVPWTI